MTCYCNTLYNISVFIVKKMHENIKTLWQSSSGILQYKWHRKSDPEYFVSNFYQSRVGVCWLVQWLFWTHFLVSERNGNGKPLPGHSISTIQTKCQQLCKHRLKYWTCCIVDGYDWDNTARKIFSDHKTTSESMHKWSVFVFSPWRANSFF